MDGQIDQHSGEKSREHATEKETKLQRLQGAKTRLNLPKMNFRLI